MSERTQLIRRILANFLRYVLAPLAFIGLVLLVIWFLFWRSDDKPAKTTSGKIGSSQTDKQKKAGESNGTSGVRNDSDDRSGTPSSGTNETPATPPTSGSATGTTPPSGQTQALADSGPGEVIALFLVVSGAAAGARYLLLYRKLHTS